jgi:sRNA-binding carbon storage regulator CsrA
MLILSRHVNESLVIADSVVVTVLQVLPEVVQLAVGNIAGTDNIPFSLTVGASQKFEPGARITLVEMKSSKARLGIDAEPGISVYRKEVWDAMGRPTGLPYPLPETGRDPSLN